MSQKVKVILVDDLDKGPADKTTFFSYNGTDYVIDLSTQHYLEFEEAIKPFVKCARPKALAKRRHHKSANLHSTSGVTQVNARKSKSKEIREWAKTVGINVRDRGRIPRDIVEQYEHRNDPPMAGDSTPPITVTKSGPTAKKAKNAGQKVGRTTRKKT